MMSAAIAEGWPFRGVASERKRVVPWPRKIWNDDAVAFGREQGRDVDKAVDVVGPSVQENDRRAFRGTGFGIADIEHAGVDLLQRRE